MNHVTCLVSLLRTGDPAHAGIDPREELEIKLRLSDADVVLHRAARVIEEVERPHLDEEKSTQAYRSAGFYSAVELVPRIRCIIRALRTLL